MLWAELQEFVALRLLKAVCIIVLPFRPLAAAECDLDSSKHGITWFSGL